MDSPAPHLTDAFVVEKVCALIVTYNPDDAVWEHIATIRRQVHRTIVVDNASGADVRRRLAAFAGEPDVELVLNNENVGVATALNLGAERARCRGYAWLATFDQDSRVPDDFVASLGRAWSAYPERDRVAIVAPVYRDRHLGTVTSPSEPLTGPLAGAVPVSVTATSGNLVSLRAVQEIGGFRDDFFIDCVDFEFCLRARRRRWLVLEVRSVQIEHAQGRATRRRWLWRQPVVNDYGAQRRYYQARNRVVMFWTYVWFDPSWVLRDAIGYVSDLTKMLLFCGDRGAKTRAVVLGWWHALVGRRGRWVVAEH